MWEEANSAVHLDAMRHPSDAAKAAFLVLKAPHPYSLARRPTQTYPQIAASLSCSLASIHSEGEKKTAEQETKKTPQKTRESIPNRA